MKRFTSKTQRTGELGETLAAQFLLSRGFSILERNYTKRVGEIDIVARTGKVLHFVEVKTLYDYGGFRETEPNPFENVTPFKMGRIFRTAAWYLAERGIPRETRWVVDVVAVVVSRETRHAKIRVLWNVIA